MKTVSTKRKHHADIARYAPLILVPVELDRRSASEKFCVKWTGDDIEENLSLRAKLSKEFSIELPDFPDEEEMTPTAYFAKVRNCVAEGKNWAVLENEMTLGFFSFAKFLMYRDLDPENWPNRDLLLGSPLVSGLLSDGFSEGDLLLADDASIDEVIPASKLDHEDELVNRIRNLWNFSRAGSRIQDAVEKAVRHLRVTQQCSREDACLTAY